MRKVAVADITGSLVALLDAVEKGESVVIEREGRAIARLVPDVATGVRTFSDLAPRLAALRATMPRLALDDILSARDEGRA